MVIKIHQLEKAWQKSSENVEKSLGEINALGETRLRFDSVVLRGHSQTTLTGFLACCPIDLYNNVFSFFFRKRVVNITFLELRPLSNERSGNFTIYRGFH